MNDDKQRLREEFESDKRAFIRWGGKSFFHSMLRKYRELHGIVEWHYILSGHCGNQMFLAIPYIGFDDIAGGDICRWHK